MSERMTPIPFWNLVEWIFQEYAQEKTIFGIPQEKFYYSNQQSRWEIFGETLETPVGPAAGPHTQLAQNIICSYLTGGRFFELKTVQKLDRLKIEKPCIDAQDEGYNVEWSQELTLDESFREYVKAWAILHLLKAALGLSTNEERGFVFNISLGYDLEGIKSPRMDRFIEEMKDASLSEYFKELTGLLSSGTESGKWNFGVRGAWSGEQEANAGIGKRQSEHEHEQDERSGFKSGEKAGSRERIRQAIDRISPHISNSVTLSTMHGCPPQEIEAIAEYLIKEKGLHTYVKLNPTLLGLETVKEILQQTGFGYIELDRTAFEHDLQMRDAIPMLQRLQEFARERGKQFGVKLSNTLGALNSLKRLPGKDMYLSGRALFPLTIHLSYKLAMEFKGELNISFSGGATVNNIEEILQSGIYPVTMVTDLLKPGGYLRIRQIMDRINRTTQDYSNQKKVDLEKLKILTDNSLKDKEYQKSTREINSIKISRPLPLFDCYLAPCQEACPIHQDVAEYIRLVEEGRYEEAVRVITERNPLPHITGYICDHQCMSHCTRWDYDQSVEIREMKKVAVMGAEERGAKSEECGAWSVERRADNGGCVGKGGAIPMGEALFTRDWQNDNSIVNNASPLHEQSTLEDDEIGIDEKSARVAILGAGPSGLAAGYFLAREGLDVTIFEKNDRAGGVVQNLIPEFRLPQDVIDKDIDLIKKQGVKFHFGAEATFSIEKLQGDGFRYIYLAIGAGKSKKLALVEGSDQVLDVIDFLWDFHHDRKMRLGKIVAVIGGGNSAMDGARAALHCPGVEKVSIIYRRTKEFMPADREEILAAGKDGVGFRELLLPLSWEQGKLKCQKMRLAGQDSDGRRKVEPMDGEFENFAVDSVIAAIGEQVETDILVKNGIKLTDDGWIAVNPDSNETSVANVFIGGDALSGPATVVEAIADARKAADEIIRREDQTKKKNEKRVGTPEAEFELIDRQRWINALMSRKGAIVKPEGDVNEAEAARCLGCSVLCNKCLEVCPNRANVAIVIEELKNSFQILHIDGLCNECGNCETFCPWQGAPYKQKSTLFWTEDSFNACTDSGIFFPGAIHAGISLLKIRIDGQTKSFSLKEDVSSWLTIIQDTDEGKKEVWQNMMLVAKKISVAYAYLIQKNLQVV